MSGKFVVLSNGSQYKKFVEAGLRPGDFKVFCDNPRFYSFLDGRGIPFEALDEYLLKTRWSEINAWGCAAVNNWMKACRDARIFSDVDYASVTRLFFSYILIPAVKNREYAGLLLKRRPDRVLIFQSLNPRKYPYFSGNFFLNYFLDEGCRQARIPETQISVYELENDDSVSPLQRSLVADVKRGLKKTILSVYGALARANCKMEILAQGSLAHLGPVVRELKRCGRRVAIYDFEFHQNQWNFSRALQIPYWTPSSFGNRSPAEKGESAENVRREFSAALDLAERSGIFVYQDRDFSVFVKTRLLHGIGDYLKRLSREALLYENLIRACSPRAFLVDEDYASRGAFLGAFMKARGVKMFCVSHANLAVSFAVPEESRCFSHSTTFVHSEFEKAMYAARGWDPQKISVTGTPRYDRLSGQSPAARPPVSATAEKVKFLYPATGIWLHSPDQHGYLGSHFTTWGGFQKPAFRMILEALEGLPAELIVKPHSVESVPLWREFFKELKPAGKARLVPQSADFLTLLKESRGMVLSYWSTGLIESAILRKPTLFVVPEKFESRILDEYAAHGFCRLFRSAADLRKAFEGICRGERSRGPSLSEKDREYYLGRNDSQGAARVVREISEVLETHA
ncbi:MAG: hypothetical protein HYT89_03750 [Candidatus Omnitrophica bacterium]|nr:hypothetical protein [Candidatus Omnitrophota bacterium]